jgi:hypothetical protein
MIDKPLFVQFGLDSTAQLLPMISRITPLANSSLEALHSPRLRACWI